MSNFFLGCVATADKEHLLEHSVSPLREVLMMDAADKLRGTRAQGYTKEESMVIDDE